MEQALKSRTVLSRIRRRVVPFVPQTTDVDCGAASLTMSLQSQGVAVHLNDVRAALSVGRDGVSASEICEASRCFGFRGRAVRIDLDTLHLVPMGTILHWELRHFVVFERCVRGGIVVVDPSVGRRRVSNEELNRSLSGVAILVQPGRAGYHTEASRPSAGAAMRAILFRSPEFKWALAASIALQAIVGLLSLLSGALVDSVVPTQNLSLFWILGIGFGWLAICFVVFSLLRGGLLAELRTRFDFTAGTNLLVHLSELPLQYFQQRSAGDLMVRVRSNEKLREALSGAALAGVLDGSLVLLYLLVLAWLQPSISIAVLALATIQWGLHAATSRRSKELLAEAQHRQGLADGHLMDMLNGIQTLKASGAEVQAVMRWSSLYADVLNAILRRERLTVLVEAGASATRTVGPYAVLLLGVIAAVQGQMSLGVLFAVLSLSQGILQSTASLVTHAAELDSARALVERLDDVFLESPEQTSTQRPAPRLDGGLALRRITYRPTPQAQPLVQDISVEIPAGSFVAVVGGSGSGKSTLSSIVAGLIRPNEGSVQYDGIDLQTMDVRSVRRQIGVVVQRAQLFGVSVRDNITMLEDAPLHRVEAAARMACIHEDIAAMRMGYMTPVVGGGTISGGQWQRIALARALLREPSILILDEATSALDAVTEAEIFSNLRQLGCTRIVIAHRLSTVADADVILVMQGGKIVERGSHERLLALNGHYASLVAAQARTPPASEAQYSSWA